MRKKVLILGAAGRDFHNFNVFFRDNKEYEVVAFTATQIPNIEGRKYPPELAGELYPDGIPIYGEGKLEELVEKEKIDIVCFSYSDVSHEYVMHRCSRALSKGASFLIIGPRDSMLVSSKPVIAVGAVRTGCGKSQTTRRVSRILKEKGVKFVVVRHPMPYGDLVRQKVQRFASFEDLDSANCTIEEREEYEPLIRAGNIVYGGVDYSEVLHEAEKEADIIVWDGGNNDWPFFKPDLFIVVTDPHRVGHELSYHPGEANLRMANVIVINKVDSASFEKIEELRRNIREANPSAKVVEAASPVFIESYNEIRGKRVVVVEDGPTLTHGEMGYGAGYLAARKFGAREIVDPRKWARGSIREAYDVYRNLGLVLPALGYSREQLKELEETINSVEADCVVSATPVDLSKLIKINKPIFRVFYELQEIGKPNLDEIIVGFLEERKLI